MSHKNNEIWIGVQDKTNDPSLIEASKQEFYELPIVDSLADEEFVNKSKTSRRDFLKYLGFGVGAATLAASCDIPVKKAIPYVVKPDAIVPGVASYYASTFVQGSNFCSVLVKTREGRPIKIEGNPSSKITKGGTSARAQASVLSLYDTSRYTSPGKLNASGKLTEKMTWEALDKQVMTSISANSQIRILTNSLHSPTTLKAIEDFKANYANTKVVSYDPISVTAMLLANEGSFGEGFKLIPSYAFDKAKTIVSFGADFLGTWISPIEFASQYAENRKITSWLNVKDGAGETIVESLNAQIEKAEKAIKVLAKWVRYTGEKVNTKDSLDTLLAFFKDFASKNQGKLPKEEKFKNEIKEAAKNLDASVKKVNAYKEDLVSKMSKHYQVESNMSLTGTNADNRILVKPSEQGSAIAYLYSKVTGEGSGGNNLNAAAKASLDQAAKDLLDSRGASLVVSNSNNIAEQTLVNKINDFLGNYGSTIDFTNAYLTHQGDETEYNDFVKELKSGSIDAVFVMGANPAFDTPDAAEFKEAFSKVKKMRLSFAIIPDETTALCDYVAPNHHYLESWGDAQPKMGHYSLIQPTIRPLFNTRQAEASLLTWGEVTSFNTKADQPYYEYLKQNWETNMFSSGEKFATFQRFWDATLHDGVYERNTPAKTATFTGDASSALSKITKPAGDGVEITFYETVNMGAGEYANNPWLQEMPDPVIRTVWGNYLSVNIQFDGVNNYSTFKNLGGNQKGGTGKAKLTIAGKEIALPSVEQFGQMENTVACGLGYGREIVGAAGKNTGSNVYPMLTRDADGLTQYYAVGVDVQKIGMEKEFASVQYHHTMGVKGMDTETNKVINVDEKVLGYKGYQGSLTNRSIVYQNGIEQIDDLIRHIHHKREEAQYLNSKSLYPGYSDDYKRGHHWAMSIDLNACIGCSACTVACMAENNVPVVGKKEVHRHHEMTWLRIDRYYYGDVNNPSVVYQPMMCQHCDNAPCENVCPVAATNHSSEGLNQMTYNRCIGTRYCANNCPYKVRRFNWLDYTTADLWPANEYDINGETADGELPFGADNLTRMVLNPDVTVRTRGVIEKCSFCVQRIQEGKLTAKREGRRLRDAEVKTACQTACPTGAIIFGDRNNENGELTKRMSNPLSYLVLEEVNTQSSVFYAAKLNNRTKTETEETI